MLRNCLPSQSTHLYTISGNFNGDDVDDVAIVAVVVVGVAGDSTSTVVTGDKQDPVTDTTSTI